MDNFDASLHFWRGLFGALIIEVREVEELGFEEMLLQLSKDPAVPFVQLVRPTREGTSVQKWVDRHRGGLHHLAFSVPDVGIAGQTLLASNRELVFDDPLSGSQGRLANFVRPLSGESVLVEFIESAGSEEDDLA